MPLKSYGVLVGRAVDARRESGTGETPHYQLRVEAEGADYRIAVNVRSQESPSELLYLVDDDYRHPITGALGALPAGWNVGGPKLDFVRQNLFDRALMRALPADVEGPGNDLADVLDAQVQRAIQEPAALVYVSGERWGPEDKADKVFGFTPGNGVHDIHMNQGNVGQFRKDDGVWQDGALIIALPDQQRWIGIFLAFQSQAWHTDDQTGHTITGAPSTDFGEEPVVRIVAALVNPTGPAPEAETVTLLNASPDQIDLTGWRLLDRAQHGEPVPAGVLAAGAATVVRLAGTVQLGNSGGEITLLDKAGLKVHGVAYTAAEARSGWTVVF